MIAKLMNRKLILRLNHNLFDFKECKTYLSISYRMFCINNSDKTYKINDKLISNKKLSMYSMVNFSSFDRILNNNKKSLEVLKRNLSEKSDNDDERPVLMSFRPKYLPNLWYQWKNLVTIYLIIRPFLDNDFSLNKFMNGSKQALVYISNCLADKKLDSLKGLVTDEAMNEIRGNLSLFNAKQLEELRFQLEDIIYSFPYRIGIIMTDNDNKRYVEITVVFYCLLKYQKLRDRPELTFEEFKKKFGDKITVCNYRFIRDYSKGAESDWSVNQLSHFINN